MKPLPKTVVAADPVAAEEPALVAETKAAVGRPTAW